MNLLEIIRREQPPQPWAEGEKIPWSDPAFSRRMLREHLSQEHDAASRRTEIIERQVAWIHERVLGGRPCRVLDLGCGPGLYTRRLARLGHLCTGIDYAPAAIAYARAKASDEDLGVTYLQADMRQADYGPEGFYGLAMLIFGELNAFRREDAAAILAKAHAALAPNGRLLLEPHTFGAVERIGKASADWYAAETGLFAEHPHLLLHESYWHEAQAVATERYYLVDAAGGEVTRYACSMQAYTEADYRRMLHDAGFGDVRLYPSLTGSVDAAQEGLLAIVAAKPA